MHIIAVKQSFGIEDKAYIGYLLQKLVYTPNLTVTVIVVFAVSA